MSNNINLIKSFLNYSADKSKVINQNIANINSPDYKRRDIDFGSYLQKSLNSTSELKNSNQIVQSTNKPSVDENIFIEDRGVNIEEEMAELAKNTINFKFAAKRISGYYRNIQSVIRSGGR